MAIKVLAYAFHPEAFFKQHEMQLEKNGIQVCAYVSLVDPVLAIYEEHTPDVILFDSSSINITMYTNTFDCPLLAVANVFDLNEHHSMRLLRMKKAETDLRICGYIQNRIEFLITAIQQAMQGQQSFYTDAEILKL